MGHPAHVVVGTAAGGLLTIIEGADHASVGTGFGQYEVVLKYAGIALAHELAVSTALALDDVGVEASLSFVHLV